MNTIKLFFVGIFLLATLTTCNASENFAKDKPRTLKDIHKKLYDLYLPDDSRLSTIQRMKRYFYRTMIWYKISDNQDLMALLKRVDQVGSEIPKDLRLEFEDAFTTRFDEVPPQRFEELSRKLMQV